MHLLREVPAGCHFDAAHAAAAQDLFSSALQHSPAECELQLWLPSPAAQSEWVSYALHAVQEKAKNAMPGLH